MLCRLLLFSAILFAFPVIKTESCADKVKSCNRAVAYCNRSSLQKTLRENCALTCKFCTPTPGSPKNRPKPKSKPRSTTYPKYKLHYFDIRFRGETVRLMFNYKGVKFEDYRIAQNDWPSLKDTYPNKQIPALEINGKMLMQSGSMYRYLGKKLDLFGKDELETAFLDSTAELYRELFDAATPFVQAKIGLLKNADPNDLFKNQFEPALKSVAPQLVKLLGEQTSGFFGSQVSWVDFYIADSIFTYNGFVPQSIRKYPELLQHQQKVYDLPKIKQYLANRPKSPI